MVALHLGGAGGPEGLGTPVAMFRVSEQLGGTAMVPRIVNGKGSGSSFTTLAILQNSQISQIGAKNFVIV